MESIKKIKITYFNRKPLPLGNFSIEIFFNLLQEKLSSEFIIENKEMPFYSKGLLRRFLNMIYVYINRGDINHITGDIYYVSAFLKPSNTIITFLDCVLLKRYRGIKLKIIKLFWYYIPSKRSNYIIAISKATKNDLYQLPYFMNKNINVINIAVNSIFKKSLKPFNQDYPKILQLGTAENKNIERLIQAISGVRCKIVIVGKLTSSLKEKLISKKVDFTNIEHRLTDNEIHELYLDSDIVSMVSTLEGFGMPIIEAQKIGRIVLGSNVSSIPEIAGKGAYFVNPYDVISIRNGILEIINNSNLREQIISEGLNNAKAFNLATIAKNYSELYKNIP